MRPNISTLIVFIWNMGCLGLLTWACLYGVRCAVFVLGVLLLITARALWRVEYGHRR
jgi:hypothetical protein